MHHNAIASLHFRHAGANLENRSTSFMAKKMRNEAILTLPSRDFVDLLSTDSAVFDADENLSYIELGNFYFVDFQGGILLYENSGLH
jgi:hypothetical protein